MLSNSSFKGKEKKMAITFRIIKHSMRPGVKLVEILLNDNVVGVIYPDMERDGIKVVSAHFSEKDIPEDFDGEVIKDSGEGSFPPIPSVKVTFKPRRYVIRGGKIQYLE